jgi:hypothetical protein
MAFLNMMLSHWKKYFQEIKKSMAKLVEDFCPEAPQIARYLMETHSDLGVSVHLDAANFCPWLYFDQPQEDPHLNKKAGMEDDEPDLNKRVELEEEPESSDSEDPMDEDDRGPWRMSTHGGLGISGISSTHANHEQLKALWQDNETPRQPRDHGPINNRSSQTTRSSEHRQPLEAPQTT